jgi:hypothetical protein
MTRNIFASAAFAALLGAGALAANTTPAAAAYLSHRCDANGCWTVRCDDDGDYCRRVCHYAPSSYYRGNGFYIGNSWHSYDRDNYRRHWVCDPDGDDCHWSYRSY